MSTTPEVFEHATVRVAGQERVIQPLGNRVLVRLLEQEQEGAIIIPEAAQDKEQQGEVLGIGPEVKHVALGDYVLVAPYAGITVNKRGGYTADGTADKGATWLLIHEVDILAVFQ